MGLERGFARPKTVGWLGLEVIARPFVGDRGDGRRKVEGTELGRGVFLDGLADGERQGLLRPRRWGREPTEALRSLAAFAVAFEARRRQPVDAG
jgi:hypothetical protein